MTKYRYSTGDVSLRRETNQNTTQPYEIEEQTDSERRRVVLLQRWSGGDPTKHAVDHDTETFVREVLQNAND